MKTLKCLSTRQPYVERILTGRKKYEVRSWRTDHTGLLLIHAAKKADLLTLSDYPIASNSLGAICGIVEIGKAINDKWSMSCPEFDQWKWPILRYHKFATPIPYRGQQRIFNVPMDAIIEQMDEILKFGSVGA